MLVSNRYISMVDLILRLILKTQNIMKIVKYLKKILKIPWVFLDEHCSLWLTSKSKVTIFIFQNFSLTKP